MTRVTTRLSVAAAIGVAGVLVLAGPAAASTVTIQDDANVLNVTTVQNAAAELQVPIYIWTTTQDSANKSAFDQDVQAKVSGQFPLVLGINTAARHEALRIGEASGFTEEAANAAASSANSAFDGVMSSRNDYTGAVRAALTSLHSSLAARGAGQGRSHGFSVGTGILVFVVIMVVLGLVGRIFRGGRRRRMRGFGPQPGYGQGYEPGYGPGQGYGPGYGGGYGPGYGGGMGRGTAAGLGAVGGGLLGYELGREAGENEQFRRDEDGGFGDQGGGGDGGGGWVTGQDSDFGGGGDFGGGDGGGGGGGGDW